MPGTPTASHAYNLFSLTMESRHGRAWARVLTPDAIACLAHEIAAGFGGEAEDRHDHMTLWRFPDGSRAQTGAFGLRPEDDGAASRAA